MHEFSIASSIAESVLGFCAAQRVERVLEVRLSIGELTHVEAEQLRFCFNAITQETPLQAASLEIEPIKATVRCPYCSYEGSPKYWDSGLTSALVATLQCPECGRAAEAVLGHECSIKAIKFLRHPETSDLEDAAL